MYLLLYVVCESPLPITVFMLTLYTPRTLQPDFELETLPGV
jgi:hypothetical protein